MYSLTAVLSVSSCLPILPSLVNVDDDFARVSQALIKTRSLLGISYWFLQVV